LRSGITVLTENFSFPLEKTVFASLLRREQAVGSHGKDFCQAHSKMRCFCTLYVKIRERIYVKKRIELRQTTLTYLSYLHTRHPPGHTDGMDLYEKR